LNCVLTQIIIKNQLQSGDELLVTIAVFGVGDIGQSILRGLATYPEVTRIWAFSLNVQRLESVVADIATIAYYRDRNLDIQFQSLDLRNLDRLTETLATIRPDVIVNATTLRAWWVPMPFSPEIQRQLQREARQGPWLPLHLTLTLNLMKARQQGVPDTPVVNIALPDLVNPVLNQLNLAPTCGAGNSEFLHAAIAYIVSRRLGIPITEIQVEMVAHHFHCNYFWGNLAEIESLEHRPYWIGVFHQGTEITQELNPQTLFKLAGEQLPQGRVMAVRTGESAVKNIMRLVRNDRTRTHVCSPLGHGGGYDVRLSRDRPEILYPRHLSLEAARQIEAQGLIGDGIQSIEPSGEVIFTSEASAAMNRILGYNCRSLKPEDSAARAVELIERLKQYPL
jgi:hypothetical protein